MNALAVKERDRTACERFRSAIRMQNRQRSAQDSLPGARTVSQDKHHDVQTRTASQAHAKQPPLRPRKTHARALWTVRFYLFDPVKGRHTFCCFRPRDVGSAAYLPLTQRKAFYLLIVEGRPWRGRCRTPSPSKAHADTARNTTSDFSSLAREARNHTLFSLCCKAPCWKNDGLTVENHPATIFDGWKVLNWLHF